MTRNTAATDIPDTIQFVLEIDKLKGVLRNVPTHLEERYENTAEHSWQIALFRTLDLKIDVTRVVAMLLRLGGNELLTAADRKSWITYEDFSIALLDEVEQPKHIRERFTVGY
jgi:hypothetical protein